MFQLKLFDTFTIIRRMTINTIISNKKTLFYIGLGLSILPIITYYAFVFYYAVNIPFYDEYFGSLGWIDQYKQKDFPNNMLLLFGQANEHRIFTFYFSVLSQYLILGEVNYRYLILIGNIGMMGLLYISFRLENKFRNNLLLFLPVILLLFVPIHEISDWGMLTIQGIVQYLLVFSSLALLNKQGKIYFSLAILLAALATFSFGSGMFTFIAGLFLLYFSKPRSWLRISLWASFMVLFVWLYFINYNFHVGAVSKLEILNHPLNAITYFLTFFGRIFIPFVDQKYYLLTIAGAFIFSYFLYLIWDNRRYISKNSLIFSYLLFILLSVVAVTISRASYGPFGSMSPRYALRATMFIIFIYILALRNKKELKHNYIFLLLGLNLILYAARINFNNTWLTAHNTKLKNGIASFYIDPSTSSLASPNLELSRKLMTNAINKGFYNPPSISELFPDIYLLNLQEIIRPSNQIIMHIDVLIENPVLIKVSGWAFLEEKNSKSQKIGIVLLSESDKFVISTMEVSRKDVVNHFENNYSDAQENCGFNLVLDKKFFNLKSGAYQVGVCIYHENQILSTNYSNKYVNF